MICDGSVGQGNRFERRQGGSAKESNSFVSKGFAIFEVKRGDIFKKRSLREVFNKLIGKIGVFKIQIKDVGKENGVGNLFENVSRQGAVGKEKRGKSVEAFRKAKIMAKKLRSSVGSKFFLHDFERVIILQGEIQGEVIIKPGIGEIRAIIGNKRDIGVERMEIRVEGDVFGEICLGDVDLMEVGVIDRGVNNSGEAIVGEKIAAGNIEFA